MNLRSCSPRWLSGWTVRSPGLQSQGTCSGFQEIRRFRRATEIAAAAATPRLLNTGLADPAKRISCSDRLYVITQFLSHPIDNIVVDVAELIMCLAHIQREIHISDTSDVCDESPLPRIFAPWVSALNRFRVAHDSPRLICPPASSCRLLRRLLCPNPCIKEAKEWRRWSEHKDRLAGRTIEVSALSITER
jgi:hypothetical protein